MALEQLIPTPVELTNEEKTKDQAQLLVEKFVSHNTAMIMEAFTNVWYNRYGLTPEQACLALGSGAVSRMTLFSMIEQMIFEITGKPITKNYPPGYDGVLINEETGFISPKSSVVEE